MADLVLDLLGRAEPYLGAAQPWLERAVRVFALGEPVGRLPVPAALDAAAVLVRNGLTSRYFPLRLYNINLRDLALSRAIVVIAAAPLIWNFVAQAEYRTRVVSRILGKWVGAYLFALWIFCFSLYRDLLFLAALQSQPPSAVMLGVKFAVGGVAMYTVGFVLVASSMLRLGITGTYLGDYFGILMDAKVEAFPFNMFDNPMYDGATLCFLGKSFMDKSPAGVFLSVWIYIVYQVAVTFEEPFTAQIYADSEPAPVAPVSGTRETTDKKKK